MNTRWSETRVRIPGVQFGLTKSVNDDENVRYRLALHDALKKRKIKLDQDPCMFNEIISNPKIKVSTSASDSIIIFGNLNYRIGHATKDEILLYLLAKNTVVVKLYFEPKAQTPFKSQVMKNRQQLEQLDNGTLVENSIYFFLINDLLEKRYTPNVFSFITVVECNNFLTRLKEIRTSDPSNRFWMEIDQTVRTRFMADPNVMRNYDLNKVYFNIFERGYGEPLYDSGQNKGLLATPISIRDWKRILFQVIYTLHVFELYGIQHNDLHLGNVYIETNTSTFNIYVTNLNTQYLMETRYFVKIYDFDNAIARRTQYNTLQDDLYNTRLTVNKGNTTSCQWGGMCNTWADRYDVFFFLNALFLEATRAPFNILDRKDEAKFIRDVCRILTNGLVEEWQKPPFRLCHKINDKCVGSYMDDPVLKSIVETRVYKPGQMLNHSMFDDFKLSKDDVQKYLNFAVESKPEYLWLPPNMSLDEYKSSFDVIMR